MRYGKILFNCACVRVCFGHEIKSMYPVEGNFGLYCSILIYKWLYNDFIEYFNWFIIDREREEKGMYLNRGLATMTSQHERGNKRHRERHDFPSVRICISNAPALIQFWLWWNWNDAGFFLVSFVLLLFCRRETLVDPPSIDTHKWMVKILNFNQPKSKIKWHCITRRFGFDCFPHSKVGQKRNTNKTRINVKGHWSDTELKSLSNKTSIR